MLPPRGAKPSKDGRLPASLREHLESAERQTGRCDPRLDEPELPAGYDALWCSFWTIYTGQVLTFAEIDAHARMTGEEPTPREAVLLRAMSVVALKEAQSG